MPGSEVTTSHRLLLFTKPARPGRVKTRLIGELTAEQAAELHEAFLLDLLERLAGGDFELVLAWALEDGESPPAGSLPWVLQEGADLGARLHRALATAAADGAGVAAIGSDHPSLGRSDVETAFAHLEAGADVVLGPAADGGYYLVALTPEAVRPDLFTAIPWSTPRVLEETLARCRAHRLAVHLLPEAADVDTPEDLHRLAGRLAEDPTGCPRTLAALAAWDLLPRRSSRPLGDSG